MHNILPSTLPLPQIRHRHNLHHQTGPAGEMLRSLPSARFRIILLPREARPFPFVKHVFHKVFPKRCVNLGGLRSVRTGLGCNVLHIISDLALFCIH